MQHAESQMKKPNY